MSLFYFRQLRQNKILFEEFFYNYLIKGEQNGGISEEEIAKNKPRKKGVVSRATLRNRNVYRTTSDLKAKYCYKYDIDVISFKKEDTCLISVVNDEIPYLDYTIINEDVNGYVIIEILPRVIITMNDQDKIVRRPIIIKTLKLMKKEI